MNRDYYKVLIVSQPGKGKTYSFRNMDSETTGFINVEDKPLPFKNKFKNLSRPKNYAEFKRDLKLYSDNKDITCIVIDSLSTVMEMILRESRATKKGFEIWNYYNEEISNVLNFIKTIQKEVFVTVHYEWVADGDGNTEKRAKVKGKEWEGLLEKEFTMVLYADRITDMDNKKVYAWFNLALEESSCKCPPDIFGIDVFIIDNDCKIVLDKILEFVN